MLVGWWYRVRWGVSGVMVWGEVSGVVVWGKVVGIEWGGGIG